MTIREESVALRLLGALEAHVDGTALALGGGKQRAVLAVLLLSADEVVPITRLVDEVWGEAPPPSAAHSLEAYVSRLRQLLGPHGPSVQRLGAGYRLQLGEATLDARTFTRLSEEVSLAAAMGDDEGAANLAREALALWRGPVLADVVLASAGRADAERLEELRLRTYERRFDAELALGLHGETAGELQALVDQNPYRERFVAQLMLALYRAGRHVEALQAYERTRKALADDMGLQPSAELQQLSGRMVRQDPDLDPPKPAAKRSAQAEVPLLGSTRSPSRRSVLVLATALAAGVLTVSAGGAASTSSPPGAPAVASRVALVLPGPPQHNLDLNTAYHTTLQEEAYAPDLKVRLFVSREGDLDRADQVAARIRRDGYGLVIWVGDGESARRILPTARGLSDTRFVFLDASSSTLDLADIPNASTVRFEHDQSADLTGYLSGLVAPRRGTGGQRIDTIAFLGGRDTADARRVAAALERGLRRARPNGTVLVGFSDELRDRTACETLANDQIDHGAQVIVVADAGSCGMGALAVAKTRGVWAVGEDGGLDPDTSEPGILARRVRSPQIAVQKAVGAYLSGALPAGGEQTVGLADDYAVLIENVNPAAPPTVWSKVVDLCSDIRRHAEEARANAELARDRGAS